MEGRISGLEANVENIGANLHRVEGKVDRLDAKVDSLRDYVSAVKDSLASAKVWAVCLYAGLVIGLFAAMGAGFYRFDARIDTLNTRDESLNKRQDDILRDLHTLTAVLQKAEMPSTSR